VDVRQGLTISINTARRQRRSAAWGVAIIFAQLDRPDQPTHSPSHREIFLASILKSRFHLWQMHCDMNDAVVIGRETILQSYKLIAYVNEVLSGGSSDVQRAWGLTGQGLTVTFRIQQPERRAGLNRPRLDLGVLTWA